MATGDCLISSVARTRAGQSDLRLRNRRRIHEASHGLRAAIIDAQQAARPVGESNAPWQTGAEIPFESALALERELQQQLFQSEDAKRRLDAYVKNASGIQRKVSSGLLAVSSKTVKHRDNSYCSQRSLHTCPLNMRDELIKVPEDDRIDYDHENRSP